MPQLYPMNWTLLTLFFLLMIIMTMIIFYFCKHPSFGFKQIKKNNFYKTWKW
uniref:ATP synthase F0 subunit 8 n=1 Tax=Ornithodoros coriaceus TaxID=92741 RepID=A0A3G2KJW3_ORNCO|nr:ATP synthase F0 subunit 8 [Ornithodoros coriaceus]AYN59501.1 ATP synthase F0 subunit 8 [Ornithodoros coriaceus]